MSGKKQRLELTWIGKDETPKLEPRILLKDEAKSYGEESENMLIKGDNLLALKALEQEYAGKVKCVYIDPPYNTGARIDADGKEVGYEDGLEHSIWLSMINTRLRLLNKLLSQDGVLFLHLDDNEVDYCKILLDEIFGRNNFIGRITIDARSPSAFSTVNPGVFKASEYILWYAKNKSKWQSKSMKIASTRDGAYNKFITNINDCESVWVVKPLKIAFLENLNHDKLDNIKDFITQLYCGFKDKNKKIVKEFIEGNFRLLLTSNKKEQVINYLYGKLKLGSLDEYLSFAYPYLLEHTSYFYSSNDYDLFVFENAKSVFRETEISDEGAGKETVELKYKSLDCPNRFLKLERTDGFEPVYVCNSKQISFYAKNVDILDGKLTATKLLTNIWSDISWEGIAKEGSVKFKKGKKPEKLIMRCLELGTSGDNDIVLDSFLGSGTTAAVAHKMGRRWIGIEMGEHCDTHCLPRLKAVVDGSDAGGISKSVDWSGGGGFAYYSLAPSLIRIDEFGQAVIDERYNADMLAAAMAVHEGFVYAPDAKLYWKQGVANDTDYIYTTTGHITLSMLDTLAEGLKDGESLVVCAKSFDMGCNGRNKKITLKKIPQAVLDKCEYKPEGYPLNIVNPPIFEDEEEDANE